MSLSEQPISDSQAEDLYDAIFVGLGEGSQPLVDGCDGKLTHAKTWSEANGVDFSRLQAWLHANGGFCDCEVLFNVMPDADEGDAADE